MRSCLACFYPRNTLLENHFSLLAKILCCYFRDLTFRDNFFFSAIPALQPIIHDLFVLRTASGSEIGGDLETQREVVVSMLLRLVHYPEVGWNVSWLVGRSDSKNLDQAFGWLVCR